MTYNQIKDRFNSLTVEERQNLVIERQFCGDYILKSVRYKLKWNDER